MAHNEKIRILFVGNDSTADCYLKTELEQYGYVIEYLSSEVDLVLTLVARGKKADVLLIDASAASRGAMSEGDVLANIHVPTLFIVARNERSPARCIGKDASVAEYNLRIKRLLEENRGGGNNAEPIDAFALHEIILDADGKPVDYRFLDADRKFLKRLGKTREELIGKTAMELYPRTERVWIETFGRVALTGVPEALTEYSTEFGRYFEARAYSPEKNKFLVLFIDLEKMKGAYK